MPLRIAIPNKGRLSEDAVDMLRRVGLRVPHSSSRSLVAAVNGGKYQVLYSRAQDIPEFVEAGAADLGITGLDLVKESGSRVEKLQDLQFGYCKLVIAAPEEKHYGSLEDLPAMARVATSFPNLTQKFFDERKKKITIVPVSGAAEITPYIGVSDAISDLMQSGSTLKQNHLTLLDVILDSWAVVIAGPAAVKNKKREIDDLVHAFESVQAAEQKRYLMANLPKEKLEAARKVIPGLSGPTVMELAVKGMVAVHAVVDEEDLNSVIPNLKKIGASGILVLPIERMVP